MYKQKVTYINYEGEEKTQEIMFNISKVEIIRLQAKYDGDYIGYLQKIAKSEDNEKILEFLEDFILRAYGRKVTDEDGIERFEKKDKDGRLLADKFAETEIYSEFITYLMTDEENGLSAEQKLTGFVQAAVHAPDTVNRVTAVN